MSGSGVHAAVHAVVEHRLTLIQGPLGTGKTTVAKAVCMVLRAFGAESALDTNH